MSPRVSVCLVVISWFVFSVFVSAGEDLAADEQFVRDAGISTDDRSLLDFFRKQTADVRTLRDAQRLIEQLGSDSFSIREKASSELQSFGPVVLPLLRQTMRQTADLEVRDRAREVVRQLQYSWPPELAASAARLLWLRKPSGTVETLLAFLPGPYEESVGEAIQDALVAVARDSDAIHPLLVSALSSAEPARRKAGAIALCRLARVEYWPDVRKRLHDAERSVRLSIACELAVAGDRQAVPVLIELLAELPAEEAERAEELLYRLAGQTAPAVPLGDDAIARQKCRDVWLSWWRAHGAQVEMKALKDRERQLGYTLLVLLHDNRVVEWDREGKPRWQIKGLAAPLDAEVLDGRRVLLAEHDRKSVTERALQGAILWEKKMTEPPIHAQRLPDGRTFIATRRRLFEVDRSGQHEIDRFRSDSGGIITARRFEDGRIGCIEKGTYFELSASGAELRRFAVSPGVFTTNALTPLSNGHLLIASYGGGTVQEFDRAGKVVWEIKLGRPLCALRLPGGHTLVSSQDMVLVQFDRLGKEVGRRDAPGHPCQVRRR